MGSPDPSIHTSPVYGPLSAADILDAAPTDGPEQYGKIFCTRLFTVAIPELTARGQNAAPGQFESPAGNLDDGLIICEKLAGHQLPQAADASELAYYQNTQKALCPQLPDTPSLQGTEGGQH